MHEMKNKKKLCGFSFSINMANFEVFCWNKKLSSNLFFLKSDNPNKEIDKALQSKAEWNLTIHSRV